MMPWPEGGPTKKIKRIDTWAYVGVFGPRYFREFRHLFFVSTQSGPSPSPSTATPPTEAKHGPTPIDFNKAKRIAGTRTGVQQTPLPQLGD